MDRIFSNVWYFNSWIFVVNKRREGFEIGMFVFIGVIVEYLKLFKLNVELFIFL